MREVAEFIEKLATVESGVDFDNFYHGDGAVARANRQNLRAYLEALRSVGVKILLVGEAPGYKGCALTGVPLTDQATLAGLRRRSEGSVCATRHLAYAGAQENIPPEVAQNPDCTEVQKSVILDALQNPTWVVPATRPQRELSAQAMWQIFKRYHYAPLLWNAFPFHPHPPGAPQNRAPRQGEIWGGAGRRSQDEPGQTILSGQRGYGEARRRVQDAGQRAQDAERAIFPRRAPDQRVGYGVEFLVELLELFPTVEKVYPVGRRAEKFLTTLADGKSPQVRRLPAEWQARVTELRLAERLGSTLRHPAYGGKNSCQSKLRRVLRPVAAPVYRVRPGQVRLDAVFMVVEERRALDLQPADGSYSFPDACAKGGSAANGRLAKVFYNSPNVQAENTPRYIVYAMENGKLLRAVVDEKTDEGLREKFLRLTRKLSFWWVDGPERAESEMVDLEKLTSDLFGSREIESGVTEPRQLPSRNLRQRLYYKRNVHIETVYGSPFWGNGFRVGERGYFLPGDDLVDFPEWEFKFSSRDKFWLGGTLVEEVED